MRNTLSPALSSSARRAVLALVVAPSVLVAVTMFAVYFVILPLVPALHQYYFPQSSTTYATYQVAILGHILFGSVALAVGPINLYNGLRRRHARTHRRIGGIYAVAVCFAATFAIFMSFHAYAGTLPGGRCIVTSGFITLGCIWIATLYAAVRSVAVDHDPDRHAYWMIINVSVTYSAVFFRVINSALVAMGKFDLLYPTLGWLGWLPSVALGVLLARRHYAQARQRRELHRRPTAHVRAGAMRRTGFRSARRVGEVPAARLQ
jgi:threonine dehydrogenase-like Zn-dependent dehydrogenase